VLPYAPRYKDSSVRQSGLKRFIEDDREIRRDLANRVRNILTALITAQDMGGLLGPAGWPIHKLTGDRAGTWSLEDYHCWTKHA
jgi:proteic killer suppression protein